jgi:hypothetical protein
MVSTVESLPERTPRRRRISWVDAEAIAQQVARLHTEAEACYNIGIEPRVWYLFKHRKANLPKFEALITRMRSAQIKSHLDNIADAERGRAGHRPDWRASAFMLQVKAPDRYNPQGKPSQVTINTAVTVQSGGEDGLRRLISMYSTAQQQGQPKPVLSTVEPTKALPEPDKIIEVNPS